MKNEGGTIMPMMDTSLLQSFTPSAGQGNADAWIRKEISNSLDKIIINKVKQDGIETSSVAFFTCDLMNSLAAIAEDLNTIYFFRLEEDKINMGFDPYVKLAY